MAKAFDEPQTPEEWQLVVDAAAWQLAVRDCRLYGLVTGGPKANVERCEELLERGKRLGYVPSPDHLERVTAAWNEAASREAARQRVIETGKG